MKPAFVEEVNRLLQSLSIHASESFKQKRFLLHALHQHQPVEVSFVTTPQSSIHIREDQWYATPEIITSRLQALAGKIVKKHARSGVVKRIDKVTCDGFLNENHLYGATGAYYKAGIYIDNELVAVATFSKPRIMNDGPVHYRSYEWERFATKKGTAVNGGLSKLLAWFIQLTNPAHIMTYIDLDWGDGKGYQTLGFKAGDVLKARHYEVKPGDWHRIPLKEFTAPRMGYVKVENSGSRKFILDRR